MLKREGLRTDQKIKQKENLGQGTVLQENINATEMNSRVDASPMFGIE